MKGLKITWLLLACVNVEGRREIMLLIAVAAAEVLSDDKTVFYAVHWLVNLACSFEK